MSENRYPRPQNGVTAAISRADREVTAGTMRAFLLKGLQLRGKLAPEEAAATTLQGLAMVQIDSIRITGLRNHELAFLARVEAPVPVFYQLLYEKKIMSELHYPVFAVRQDWARAIMTGLAQPSATGRRRRQRLREAMDEMANFIAREGPVTAAQFTARRVKGGFNTIKATTQALELLFQEGRVCIAGRTPQFHRIFDLTERTAPELAMSYDADNQAHRQFIVLSALHVLKSATREQWAARAQLHYGTWRKVPRATWLAAVDSVIAEGKVTSVRVTDLPAQPIYYHLPENQVIWEQLDEPEESVRILPPLDNLLFSRARFAELFGFHYKFEAYTPAEKRQFYFALPILYKDQIVGLVDAKKDNLLWRITGLSLRSGMEQPTPEAFAQALLRLARHGGAERLSAEVPMPKTWRRILTQMTAEDLPG